MKFKGSMFPAVIFLILGLFGIIQSLSFQYWESIVLPLFISCCIVLLSGIQMIREFRFHRQNASTGEKHLRIRTTGNISLKLLGLIVGWTAGFALAIYILGFYIAIPVFTISYLKWHRRSWIVSIIFACSTLALSYLIFEQLLKVPLFPGLIFGGQF